MFELEILELLNKYKKAKDKYEKENIKKSLTTLILQNKDKVQEFKNNNELPSDTLALIDECENAQTEEENSQDDGDVEIIKKYYENWRKNFTKNNEVNQECQRLVSELILFYAPKRFEVIERLLEIDEDDIYEKFKNMIKNYLGVFFLKKIKDYKNSSKFEDLGFFEKRKKKKEINNLYNDLLAYKFNVSKIEEVIK